MPGSPASRPVTTTAVPKPPARCAGGAIIRPAASERRQVVLHGGWLAGGGGADDHVRIASMGEARGQGDRVTSRGSGGRPRASDSAARCVVAGGIVIQLGTR